MNLFISGQGCHTYRIPALLRLDNGRILAFCEARQHSSHDYGHIELVVRHSDDEGHTWSGIRTIAAQPPCTIGNPCPVQRADGVIVLLMNRNLGERGEDQIQKGLAPRDVLAAYSSDDGRTFTDPADITSQAKRPHWRWHATGPGHAIRLHDGTLLFPCDYTPGERVYCSHLLLSPDGYTFTLGAEMEGYSVNECMAAQLEDGRIYLTLRAFDGKHRKGATSFDGGHTCTPPRIESALPDPICQGSVLYAHGLLWLCNCASLERERLTLYVSNDAGAFFRAVKLITPGKSAYSDLCMTTKGIGMLYECGKEHPYEHIVFEEVTLEELEV